jgi:hypothetical protein
MYLKARLAVVVCAFALISPSFAAGRPASLNNSDSSSAVIECRVLEAHASAAPAALVVIFHQKEKQDQPRLAALIKENSGSDAEIQIRGTVWTKVTVFRLRTSFGRGMFLLPNGSGKLQDGDTFRIRFLEHGQK